jgi:hypothetical protein
MEGSCYHCASLNSVRALAFLNSSAEGKPLELVLSRTYCLTLNHLWTFFKNCYFRSCCNIYLTLRRVDSLGSGDG